MLAVRLEAPFFSLSFPFSHLLSLWRLLLPLTSQHPPPMKSFLAAFLFLIQSSQILRHHSSGVTFRKESCCAWLFLAHATILSFPKDCHLVCTPNTDFPRPKEPVETSTNLWFPLNLTTESDRASRRWRALETGRVVSQLLM